MQTGLFYFFGGRRHKICCELGYGVPPQSLIQLGPLQIFAVISIKEVLIKSVSKMCAKSLDAI